MSGTSSSIRTKLWWNSHWMVLFQNCVRQSRSHTKIAATVQLRCYWKQLWSRWAITGSWEPLVFKHLPKWRVDWNKYSPKWNTARHVWRVTFLLNSPTNTKYRILRMIGRYFFASTRWLRPIVHIDLYKDEVKKKSLKKNLDKNDDFVYSIYLYFAVFFFSE